MANPNRDPETGKFISKEAAAWQKVLQAQADGAKLSAEQLAILNSQRSSLKGMLNTQKEQLDFSRKLANIAQEELYHHEEMGESLRSERDILAAQEKMKK